ncbi:MAG: FKBP-type peptidyl-prolyl cis-trans isomerase, partial [Nanoarchaeota archaeon]
PCSPCKIMLQKNDFIELEFVGKTQEGEIFDTNLKQEAEKIGLDIKTRPLVICLGESMILPVIDSFLIGKEGGNDYTLSLTPQESFGVRQRELVKIMPHSVFIKKDILPIQGQTYVFDTMLGKISAISGGRVTVDFNNPLAGKNVVYSLKIKKKITDIQEKAKTLVLAYFRFELPFEIKDKKIIFNVNAGFKPLIEHFKPKFLDILGLELEVIEKPVDKPVEKQVEKDEEKEDKAEKVA